MFEKIFIAVTSIIAVFFMDFIFDKLWPKHSSDTKEQKRLSRSFDAYGAYQSTIKEMEERKFKTMMFLANEEIKRKKLKEDLRKDSLIRFLNDGGCSQKEYKINATERLNINNKKVIDYRVSLQEGASDICQVFFNKKN